MKLHLPTGLRAALIAALTAVGFTLSNASATTFTDAVLRLDDFTQASLNAAQEKGWIFQNISASEDGIFTSVADDGIISNSNSWATVSGNRTLWSGIVTININSLGTSGTGVLLETGPSPDTASGKRLEGIAYDASGNQTLEAAWNGTTWPNLTVTNNLKSFADDEGWVTVGVVFKGNGGTAVYVGGTAVPNRDLKGGYEGDGKPGIFLANNSGIQYSRLYLFGETVSDDDMAAMLSSLRGSVTWTGSVDSNWDTQTLNWVTTGTTEQNKFTKKADVIFGADASRKTVDVVESVIATAMTVNGDYTFNVKEGKTLTADNLALGAGAVTFNLEAGTTTKFVGGLTLEQGKTLNLAGTGKMTFPSLTLNGGTLNVSSDLDITATGNETIITSQDEKVSTLAINGGTTTVTGGIHYRGGNGCSIKIGTEGTEAKLVTGRLEVGDYGGGTSYLTIGADGTLVITSTNDSHGGEADYKKTGLLLSEWGQKTLASVSGKLYARNVNLRHGDQPIELTISGDGVVAVKGINKGAPKKNTNSTITLSGGKLVLGADGIVDEGGSWTIKLNSGEMGIYDNTTISRNLNVAGAVTFNTAMYTWDGEGASLVLKEGASGGNMTISGNITGTGKLIKDGAGTLVLSGAANTLSGGVDVTKGTLKATVENALGTGAITVDTAGTLDLAVRNALGGAQAVNNSGNVVLHETLATGSITGGTVTVEMESSGGLEDADGSRESGNGFSLGGAVTVRSATAGITDLDAMMYGDKDCLSQYNYDTGILTLGEEDWSTYQLNEANPSQPAVQAIMDYANNKGVGTDVLKSIVVNDDMLSLTNDSKTLKTSMLEGEHLDSFFLYLTDESVLTVDKDCPALIYMGTGANATISLEKDATIGYMTVGDEMENEPVSLKISGKGKTLATSGVSVEFGADLTLDEEVTLQIQPESAFADLGAFGEATVKLKAGAALEVLDKVRFATVDGGTEATIAISAETPMPSYDPSFAEYSVTGARITFNTSSDFELGHVIDSTSQVVNAGSGKMTDISANAAYDELAAQGGDIDLTNKESGLALRNLTVGDNRTVAMQTEGSIITVSGTAKFGSGAKVGAALTMANGATLDGTADLLTHDLVLGGSTGDKLNIGDTLWSALDGMSPKDTMNLFTGVSTLTLNGSQYQQEMDLADIFSHTDLKAKKYSLSYENNNVIITRSADNDRYWKGGTNTWDYSIKHWTDEDGSGNEVAFEEGYNAYFTNTTGGTVRLDADINAASISVTGANYTFDPNGHTLTVTDSVEVSGEHTATFDMVLVGDKLKLTVKNDGVLELNAGGDVNAVELEGGTVSVGSDTLTTDSMTVNGSSIVDGSAISTDALSGTGTLVLGGCTLTFTSSTDLTDAVSIQIAHASTLATSGEGVTLKLKEAIENPTEETVTFTGTFDLSNLTATEGETKYVEGENSDNGFKQAQKTIDVVVGGSAVGTAATLLYNGQDIGKMNTDGVVTFAQPTDYTTFYVNESGTTEKVSKALSKFSPTPGTFVLASNTTLEADDNIAMSMVTLASDAAANLLIDEGKTVTTDGATKAGLTLKGAGELAVASGKTTTGVTLDEADWKGTVSFKDVQLTELDSDWGTAKSTVALQNASGTLGMSVPDYALELRKTDENNKWGFGTSTGGNNFIAGVLKGDGDLGVREGSDPTAFTLNGSTDGWTGNFVDNSGEGVINSLTLTGAAKTIRGTVGGMLDAEGKPAYAANLYVEAVSTTTFEKAVMAEALVVSGTTNLKESSTIGRLSAGSGILSLAENKTLTIRESMVPGTKFSMGAGSKVVLEKDAYMGDANDQGLLYVGGTDGATITHSAETQQTYSLGNEEITVDGAKLQFSSYNDVVVNNVLKNVSADTLALNHSLKLNNVTAPLTVGTSLSIDGGKTFKVANGDAKQTVVMGAGSSLTTATDSVLDANLVVNNGVTLNMNAPLDMNNGALTLMQSSTLTGDLYSAIEALEDSGASVNLFKGVSALTLDTTPYSGSTQAQLYFSNLGALSDKGDYWLDYDEGIVSIRFEATSAHTLTWNGTEAEHSWVQDDETVTDWLEGSPAAPAYFQEGDNAKFTVDATVKTVTIEDDITARNITIDSPELYTFETAADHSITAQKFEMTGHDGLAKTGKGKLTLDVIGDVSLTDSLLSVQEGSVEIGTDAKSGKLSLQASALEIVEGAAFSVTTIEGDVTSSIELAGTMTVSEGTVSNLDATEGSTLKIADLGQTTAGTLSVKTDTTLYGFENGGTLDLGNKTLTLMEQTEQGGNVTANKLNLAQNGNVFNALETNRVTYACDSTGSGILDAETPNLVVDSIAPSMVIPSIALDVTETMGDGGSLAAINRLGDEVTYTLIHANDQTLVAGDFTLVGEALLIQNGLLHAESGLWSDGDNLNLTVGGLDLTWYTSNDETEWGYKVVDETGVLTDGANTLNGVQHVVVDVSREVDVTGVGSEPGLRVRNLAGLDGRTITFSGVEGDTVNLITTEATASNVNLAAENITVKVGLDALDAMDPVDYKDLRVGNVNLTGATLDVHDHEGLDDAFTVNTLSGDGNSLLKGRVIVEGKGGAYRGAYENANVILHENAEQLLYAGKGLTVAGPGAAKLAYVGPEAHMDAIEGIGMTVTLNDPKQDNSGATLVLDKASWLVDGTIVSGMSAINSAATLDTAGAPNLVQAAGLKLDGTTIILNQDAADDAAMAMAVNDKGKTKGLYLAHIGAEDSNTDRVLLNGYLYNKYYQNARLQGGKLLVDRRDAFFSEDVVRATTENGRAGAGMLDDALLELNPQVTNPQGDLAAVMTALETGAVADTDRVASAIAGASAAALGHAFNNDVQRQLRAIRNRTTTMGLAECTTHEGLPYVNAWVNAEGDYRKLDADGTLAGYTLSSWGGTIGCDVDLTNRLTVGAAFTVLHGEFTSHSADMCEGDLDRDYVSLFARYGYRAWTHTFVATLGFAKSKVDRTVNYGTGSYTTRGDSDGNAFGFLYEVGYTKALNEDASTCLQPIFNVNYRHSSLGGYTEKGGSDAALNVGGADMDAVTFGLGARLQSIVGTSVYNRATLFEGRVLAKLDAGDRDCSTNSSLIGVGRKRSVKSAEVGAFGVEVGAGLTIPVGETGGSIFMDVTGDFRSGYTEFNGTVGYRFSF